MNDVDLQGLRSLFSGPLLTDPQDMAPFLTDWRKQWRGTARAVVQPDSARDVAAVIGWCNATRTPVTPQGGNTGLSGGTVPSSSEGIVLSLIRLNKTRSLDPANNTITVEAGCVLQNVQDAAREAHRFFPLSLAAQGSCTIGGNLSTNAGGTAVLRYGNARELCLGLEVVTPQGEMWDGLRGLRKDNTGYDLRDLFIGAEGTLGVITAAVLKLYPAPAARVAALVAVESAAQALDLLNLSQQRLGPALTAFELMSDLCLDLVLQHQSTLRMPFNTRSPWYVLMEVTDLVEEVRAAEALTSAIESSFTAGCATDAVVATSLTQSANLWALRESISEAQGAAGKNIKHDIAVPVSRTADFIDEAQRAVLDVLPSARPVIFGHLGDGSLHFNVSAAARDAEAEAALLTKQALLNRVVHDLVDRYDGSISAEHGLGMLRRDEAARYKSSVEVALMRTIKRALDPLGIMNPGKVLA
jgi:FAD/FMN-containing dehydrogenase